MTDTPILDAFFKSFRRGIRSAGNFSVVINKPAELPIIAHEIAGDATHLMDKVRCYYDLRPTKIDDQAYEAILHISRLDWSVQRSRLLNHAAQIPGDVCFSLAFTLSNGSCQVVVNFRHEPTKRRITLDPFVAWNGPWMAAPATFVASHDPAVDAKPLLDGASADYVMAVQSGRGLIDGDKLLCWSAMVVLNEYFDRLADHAAHPVYRMSFGGMTRAAKQLRARRLITKPVRIIDLSKPRVEVIPVGSPMLTGPAKSPHWRSATTRTYRAARFRNMLGKTTPVRACGIHGAQPPDATVTVVKGMAE